MNWMPSFVPGGIVAACVLLLGAACTKQPAPAHPPAPASAPAAPAVVGFTPPKPDPVAARPLPTFCPAAAAGEVVSETIEPIVAWSLDLIQCTYGPDESDALVTTVYARQAGVRPVKLAEAANGPFIPLLGARKLFACEDNNVMGAKAPFIVDLAGHVTRLAPHPAYQADCMKVGTGDQVLVQYNDGGFDVPHSIIRVFDSDGSILAEQGVEHAGAIEFKVGGKSYQAAYSEPQAPG